MIKKIFNIPFVWNAFQFLVGANAYKYIMYPSVFSERSGKLLDFGCSCGNTTDVFLKFDYWGVDIDREAIRAASHKFSSYPNVRFEVADLMQGPYKSEFFDNVLFAGAAHHIVPDDLGLITKNLMSSLKTGGELHIFEPISQPKDNLITRLFVRFDQGKYIRRREALEKFFTDAGYNIVESRLFPSPDRLIKLPDFVYLRIIK